MQMNQLKRSAIGAALLAATLAVGTTAHADTVTLDVSGISSNGEFGDASNETRFINISGWARITGISWDVSLTSNGVSWLSEIGTYLSNSAGDGVALNPGFDERAPGSGAFIGIADLVASGLDFRLGIDGRLNLQFFEDYNDFLGADGSWDRGTLTVSYVPEPSSFGLAALALLGVGATTRRRKS